MATKQKSGCLAALFGIFGGNSNSESSTSSEYPYRVRDAFLSPAERSFYGVLCQVVSDRAVILCKVGLWDIFYVARPNEHRGAKSHIDRKHVDFLLCDTESMQPIVGIELNDASHQRADRQARDAEVKAIFDTAKLPLVFVQARRAYQTNEIAGLLAPHLNDAQR